MNDKDVVVSDLHTTETVERQAILETALCWVSNGHIDEYMAQHRHDENIAELKNHFDTVIDWVDSVFDYTGSEMCGLDWGRLYREYHKKSYSKSHITERVNALLDDEQVSDKKGIFEFVLGGEINYQMLNVRVFDKKTIKTVYRKQTELAKKKIYRIVHFAPSDMMQTPSESIKKPRWMPTT